MSNPFARLRAHLNLPTLPTASLNEAITALLDLLPRGEPEPVPEIDPEDGARRLDSPAEFDTYATGDDFPGLGEIAEVKFLIEGVRSTPKLWFIHTGRRAYHYDFATEVLGVRLDLAAFNRVTYFTDVRDFIAGSLVHYDHVQNPDNSSGRYAIEFWPGDPVGGAVVTLSWQLIRAALPADFHLAYHPASASHEERLARDRGEIEAAGVPLISTTELYADVRFAPLNPGVGYGVLRLMDGTDGRPPTVRDVVIYPTAPNDLPHVAGVITEEPQTPLSHINLKAKQNDTPNAFLKEAGKRPEIRGLLGRTVRFEVTDDAYDLREATPAEAEEHLDAIRPQAPQTPVADLAVIDILALADLRNPHSRAFGAKAANLGELIHLLPAGVVPQGYGVPFAAYHDFMKENGLFERARAMIEDPDFIADVSVRDQRLDDFRKRIKKADVPAAWKDRLGGLQSRFPEGTPIRCRSSTNNEDLEGFNGAGLYDSFTHRPDEGHLSRTIRQVWASLWTLRAFDERSFYRVDHLATCMGVAVHPNFDDELVNGVAVTRNVLDPRFEGYYLNCQLGESLVTNPDAGAIPEETVIGFLNDDPDAFETIPIRQSSLVKPGERVLDAEKTAELVRYLRKINPHFRQVYGRTEESFAMDLEFKVDAAGKVVIKQARPWVD